MSTPVFILSGDIDVDVSKVQRGLQDVSKSADNTAKKIGDFGNKMADVGKNLTLKLSVPILGFLGLAGKMANDLAETQRKTDVIFGNMAQSVKDWANTSEQYLGLGSGSIQAFANDIADVYMGLGATSQEAYGVTQGVVENSVKLANWAGVSTSQAVEDVKRAMLGATDSVEKYGIKLNENVLKQTMMKMGLEGTFQELTEVEKAQVRYQAILDSSGNAITYWDEGNRSMAFNIQYLKEQFGNLCEEIGNVVLPIFVDIVDKAKPVIESVVAWVKENPKLTETIVKVMGAVALLIPVVWALGAGITFLTSPINLVIIAIMLLVGAFIFCMQNIDQIKEGMVIAWQWIETKVTESIQGVANTVSNIFKGIVDCAKWMVNGVIDCINWMISAIEGGLSVDFPSFINDLGVPDIAVTLPKIPNWNYEGAIFNQPTVLGGQGVGDQYMGQGSNAEAVVPIDGLYSNVRQIIRDEISKIQIVMEGRIVAQAISPYQDEFDNFAIGRY